MGGFVSHLFLKEYIMPSRRPILADIHDLKLDPNSTHHSTDRKGRLSSKIIEVTKPEQKLTTDVKNALTFLPETIELEPEQSLVEIIDDLIDVKQQSVELLNVEPETLTDDSKNVLQSEPVEQPVKKFEEKVEQSQEKKKKFVKNVKSNTNS